MNILEFKYTNLSQDYELLFELMQTQRVICLVDNNECTDICATRAVQDNGYFSIGARGIEYIGAFEFKDKSAKEDFIDQCKKSNIRFIEPK